MISKERADQIHRIIIWESGGCICIGAKKPPFPPVTEDEDRQIKEVWSTMGGWSCYDDAVLKIRNGE